jgi:GNAT superfamily N-acetyltransferase
MRVFGRCGTLIAAILLIVVGGCAIPSPERLPLKVEDARHALDRWNPQFCKVVDFYGFHEGGANDLVAFVQIASPGHPDLKPTLYEARFQLITRPDGRQQWFLTSLMNHAAVLTRRQGWDNLFVPVEPKNQQSVVSGQ